MPSCSKLHCLKVNELKLFSYTFAPHRDHWTQSMNRVANKAFNTPNSSTLIPLDSINQYRKCHRRWSIHDTAVDLLWLSRYSYKVLGRTEFQENSYYISGKFVLNFSQHSNFGRGQLFQTELRYTVARSPAKNESGPSTLKLLLGFREYQSYLTRCDY